MAGIHSSFNRFIVLRIVLISLFTDKPLIFFKLSLVFNGFMMPTSSYGNVGTIKGHQ